MRTFDRSDKVLNRMNSIPRCIRLFVLYDRKIHNASVHRLRGDLIIANITQLLISVSFFSSMSFSVLLPGGESSSIGETCKKTVSSKRVPFLNSVGEYLQLAKHNSTTLNRGNLLYASFMQVNSGSHSIELLQIFCSPFSPNKVVKTYHCWHQGQPDGPGGSGEDPCQ